MNFQLSFYRRRKTCFTIAIIIVIIIIIRQNKSLWSLPVPRCQNICTARNRTPTIQHIDVILFFSYLLPWKLSFPSPTVLLLNMAAEAEEAAAIEEFTERVKVGDAPWWKNCLWYSRSCSTAGKMRTKTRKFLIEFLFKWRIKISDWNSYGKNLFSCAQEHAQYTV